MAEGLGQCDGVIIRTQPFREEHMALAPGLKAISRHGVGVDNIDVAAATRRGIAVLNTPGANTESVAEHALGAMLALAKRLAEGDRAVRQGGFLRRDQLQGMELAGRTLGVVGFGRVGREVARKCRAALDMHVLVYDPFVPADAVAPVGEKVDDVDELAARADVVTIHAPLQEDTRHLFDLRRLRLMKPGSLLLNMARGGIVDEEALVQVLREGPVAAAALDVFDEEPPPADHPLFQLDNVLLTPHTAAHTAEAMERMAVGAVENLLACLEGRRPPSIVNPEVLR